VFGPVQAIEAVRSLYPGGATNRFGNAWEVDRADAEMIRCLDTVGGVETFRWRWLVSVPSRMALADCSTPSSRAIELKRRCWSPTATHVVDGLTGEVMTRREAELTGPLLTDREFDDVSRVTSTRGWWEAWAMLSPFNDAIVPPGTLSRLTAAP
jgi:hypothetical protein